MKGENCGNCIWFVKRSWTCGITGNDVVPNEHRCYWFEHKRKPFQDTNGCALTGLPQRKEDADDGEGVSAELAEDGD